MQTIEDRRFFPLFHLKELYEKGEKSGELSLVTKANVLRRRAEEKQQDVEVLDREIAEAERLLARKQ